MATGEIFKGRGFGTPKAVSGEVVFNTSLTGYQEILTDPSYKGQLVCLTASHIGIVGINELDQESDKPQAQALIIRDLSRSQSNWRSTGSLENYCAKHQIAGITDIDTRLLTQHLRQYGAVNGCILRGNDEKQAVEQAKACQTMSGLDLASHAGLSSKDEWTQSTWDAKTNSYPKLSTDGATIAVLDCGVKDAIKRNLLRRGLKVEVIPYSTKPQEIVDNYAGLVLSNGPGDPQPLEHATNIAKLAIERNLPLLGICLGHQVLAQALGAKIYKMKFGHHGANHPILDHTTKKVAISSQNHGFAVDSQGLPECLEVTHTSLFDGSIAGIKHKEHPVIGFQGHPEASPGPLELGVIFDNFAELVAQHN